jgi:hypothetical protein
MIGDILLEVGLGLLKLLDALLRNGMVRLELHELGIKLAASFYPLLKRDWDATLLLFRNMLQLALNPKAASGPGTWPPSAPKS